MRALLGIHLFVFFLSFSGLDFAPQKNGKTGRKDGRTENGMNQQG